MVLYLTSFLCGTTIMVLEIVGFRLLPPSFGSSIQVWGSFLGVVMVALSAGYYGGGVMADRWPRAPVLYLLVLIAAAYDLMVLVTYPAITEFSTRFELIPGSLLAGLLLFAIPMATLAAVSPFITRLLAREGAVGSVAGTVYAVSTLGSIAGTFLTSFYLIPTIGIRASFTVSFATLCFVAGLGLVTSGLRAHARPEPAPSSP